MKIDSLILREIRIRLRNPFETSFGKTWDRRIILVEVQSDGLSGWGEVTAGEGPYYNPETTDTSWLILSKFIEPLVSGASIASPGDLPRLLDPIRGHEMAKAALENALWDLEAQRQGIPLSRILGGTRAEIPCGVSIGIQSSPEALTDVIQRELAGGYQRIKIKIKPAKDLEFIQAVRKQFPSINLMVDANSAYRLEDAAHLKCFDDYGLMMIEQPLAWDDIFDHSRLQSQLRTPVCLDESIHNVHHANAALQIGACRVINIKLGRVGGHAEARRIEELCRKSKIPVWCGGMLESGIGRAHNIAMSSLEGFVLPGDVSASKRYWDEDIIDPEVEVSQQGTIRVPARPGLGYTVRTHRIEQLTVRKEEFRSSSAQVPV
ncbi:MAG TPA: o-succinylbenzoate synthase [Candidatus Acidoferrales bacterium]|nr:o-succinylbenzoate synthase [Candidatus Acidoferrales bacterium]